MSDLTSIFDHVLANRCAYIGNEIPEGLANDTRAKTVYIGIPADLIGEIQAAHDAELAQLRAELAELRDRLAVSNAAFERARDEAHRAHAALGHKSDELARLKPLAEAAVRYGKWLNSGTWIREVDGIHMEQHLNQTAQRYAEQVARAQAQAGEGA